MQEKRLNGWKEIAGHLSVTPRTAQKWEKERGLPVARLKGGEKSPVWADPDALDRWLEGNRRRLPWHADAQTLRRLNLAAMLVIAAGLIPSLGSLLVDAPPGPPVDSVVMGRTLAVVDRRGLELWRHEFESPLLAAAYDRSIGNYERVWFGDLDADGLRESLFAYIPRTLEAEGTRLLCFSESGRVKWVFNPAAPAANREQPFSEVYRIEQFGVHDVDGDGRLEVLVSSHHLDRYPSRFVTLDPDGTVTGEYWHPGHLPSFTVADLNRDGTVEILLGGINNGRRAAVLSVLDGRRVFGTHRLDDGSALELVASRPASEHAYVVFPRTDVNRELGPYNMVTTVVADRQRLLVKVMEDFGPPPLFVIYHLDPLTLSVIRVKASDTLVNRHRQMWKSKLLEHLWTKSEEGELRKVVVLRASGSPVQRSPKSDFD